jgi:hypothetical protein
MRLKCSYDLIKPNIIIRSLKSRRCGCPTKRNESASVFFLFGKKQTRELLVKERGKGCTHPSWVGAASYSIVVPFLVHPRRSESHPIIISKWCDQRLALCEISPAEPPHSPRVKIIHDIITQSLPHPILPPIEVHIHESIVLRFVHLLLFRFNRCLVHWGFHESRHQPDH